MIVRNWYGITKGDGMSFERLKQRRRRKEKENDRGEETSSYKKDVS